MFSEENVLKCDLELFSTWSNYTGSLTTRNAYGLKGHWQVVNYIWRRLGAGGITSSLPAKNNLLMGKYIIFCFL